MHFLSEDLENYANEHTDNEPILLQELSKRTHLTVLQPRMISGHLQGRFLSLLSKLVQPKVIQAMPLFAWQKDYQQMGYYILLISKKNSSICNVNFLTVVAMEVK